MFLKRLPQTVNCTQKQSTTETRTQNHYYCMDAAAEENGIHVFNAQISKFYYWTFRCNHSLQRKFNILQYRTHDSEPICI